MGVDRTDGRDGRLTAATSAFREEDGHGAPADDGLLRQSPGPAVEGRRGEAAGHRARVDHARARAALSPQPRLRRVRRLRDVDPGDNSTVFGRSRAAPSGGRSTSSTGGASRRAPGPRASARPRTSSRRGSAGPRKGARSRRASTASSTTSWPPTSRSTTGRPGGATRGTSRSASAPWTPSSAAGARSISTRPRSRGTSPSVK